MQETTKYWQMPYPHRKSVINKKWGRILDPFMLEHWHLVKGYHLSLAIKRLLTRLNAYSTLWTLLNTKTVSLAPLRFFFCEISEILQWNKLKNWRQFKVFFDSSSSLNLFLAHATKIIQNLSSITTSSHQMFQTFPVWSDIRFKIYK